MDVQREFKLRPPREPLTSLAALVRDWQWRTAPGGGLDVKRDDVVTYCAEALSWRVAVYRAVASRRPNGKMHNHQSKVKEVDRTEFGDRILKTWPTPGRHSIEARWPETFDGFHDKLVGIRPRGIGPVTTYDVAVRLGAYLDMEPESLHLHAGVLKGWLALHPLEPFGFARGWSGFSRIERHLWPEELCGMKADDLEDFLCTYRELFPAIRAAGWKARWE